MICLHSHMLYRSTESHFRVEVIELSFAVKSGHMIVKHQYGSEVNFCLRNFISGRKGLQAEH